MNRAFVDTAGLIALTNADDQHFETALGVQADLTAAGARLWTNEWVLAEFLAGTRAKARRRALGAVDALRASPRWTVVCASTSDFAEALSLFRLRPDKHWSLVDCISINLCKRQRITHVFTSDHHFRQAGFRILLP
ncbi:MAG: type II toxin-antitoxin system VapC family toxin [Phycisphaerales bacterium]